MAESTVKGVLPVFQMPYDLDGSPDWRVLESEIRWMFEQGVDGVTLGMVSEVLRLSTAEWESATRLACKVAAEFSGPAVISVGAESTYVAVQNAKFARDEGAAAVMAIPPISTAPLDEEILDYYSALADSIDIPVIVQDASGYVGQAMSVALQAQLFALNPAQILFKPEAAPIAPRVSELRDRTDGKAGIFEGTGGIALVDSYRRGIIGTMPGADLCWAVVALWNALEKGDQDQAHRISAPLIALISMQPSLDTFLAVEKYLLMKQGVFENRLIRGPVSFHLDAETEREVDSLFVRLADVVWQRGSSI